MHSSKSIFVSVTALIVSIAACDATHPLSVKDPDVSSPNSLTGLVGLQVYRAGAEADFAISYVGGGDVANGGHEGVANFSGLFTDEMIDIETFPTRTVMNQRNAQPANGSLAGVFQDVGQAHNDDLRAIGQYKQFSPTSPGLAEIYALDGYLYLFIAEDWCSGEPFSTVNVATGAVVNSAFLTTTQMLDTALSRFQAASQAAASSDTASAASPFGELATVGTARAQLDLGDVAAAATTAATLKDATFNFQILESVNSTRQNSAIWYYNVNFPSFGEGDRKNGTGLPFVSSNDPRTAATLGEAAGHQTTPFYVNNYYKTNAAAAATTLASYTEAQLIVAEGDIFAGNYAGALAIMNSLRVASGLDWSTSDTALTNLHNLAGSTQKAQMQQLLTERAYWMWVTAHRLGDWRRVLRPPYNAAPFSFAMGDVYPTGNGLFDILEFPTPQVTNPNPNYKACDPSKP
jgi:starch-binding outer membrane protein, SusD/RagB family